MLLSEELGKEAVRLLLHLTEDRGHSVILQGDVLEELYAWREAVLADSVNYKGEEE